MNFFSKIVVGILALSGGVAIATVMEPVFSKLFGEAGALVVGTAFGTALIAYAGAWVMRGGLKNLDSQFQSSLKEGLKQTLAGNENYRDQERRREISALESRLNALKSNTPKPTPGLEIERER